MAGISRNTSISSLTYALVRGKVCGLVCDFELTLVRGIWQHPRGLFFLLGFEVGSGVLAASRGLTSGPIEGLLAWGHIWDCLFFLYLMRVSGRRLIEECNSRIGMFGLRPSLSSELCEINVA